MNDTVFDLPSSSRAKAGKPPQFKLGRYTALEFDVLAGAGALRSTAVDMLIFLESLGDAQSPTGRLVSPIITPREEGGIGLGAPHPNGGMTIAHSGGTAGTRSSIRYIPEWKRDCCA